MEKQFLDFSSELHSTVFAALVLFAVTVIFFIYLAVTYYNKRNSKRSDDNDLYLDCAYFCEQGKRPSQQDAFFISELEDYRKYGIVACVADGMGGMEHGEEISEEIAEHISTLCPMSFFATEQNAEEIRKLSDRLYDEYRLSGGSTLAMVHIAGYYMNYYSVGDSDIILIRNGNATILNPRQNYMTVLVKSLCRNNKSTQTAYSNSKARSLIDFMGNSTTRVIYTKRPMRIYDGDRIIISSDGLTDAVSLRNIPKYVRDGSRATASNLKNAVAQRNRTKQDNYTGIVFTVQRSVL